MNKWLICLGLPTHLPTPSRPGRQLRLGQGLQQFAVEDEGRVELLGHRGLKAHVRGEQGLTGTFLDDILVMGI